jgi:hypothetical protein
MGRLPANADAAPDTQICMTAISISIKPPTAPNGGSARVLSELLHH